MLVESRIPVMPSADLEKSLRFWVDGLGLSVDRAMRQDGRLVGCMVHNERLYFWLNQRAGSAAISGLTIHTSVKIPPDATVASTASKVGLSPHCRTCRYSRQIPNS